MSKGRADVPIRVGSGVVQIDIERTTIRGSVVRVTAPVGKTETGRALYPCEKPDYYILTHWGEVSPQTPLKKVASMKGTRRYTNTHRKRRSSNRHRTHHNSW